MREIDGALACLMGLFVETQNARTSLDLLQFGVESCHNILRVILNGSHELEVVKIPISTFLGSLGNEHVRQFKECYD